MSSRGKQTLSSPLLPRFPLNCLYSSCSPFKHFMSFTVSPPVNIWSAEHTFQNIAVVSTSVVITNHTFMVVLLLFANWLIYVRDYADSKIGCVPWVLRLITKESVCISIYICPWQDPIQFGMNSPGLIHTPLSCDGKFWIAQLGHLGFFSLRNVLRRWSDLVEHIGQRDDPLVYFAW